MVTIAIYLDVSTKQDTGPVPPVYLGAFDFAARPHSLDVLEVGVDRYWVQRVEMRAGEKLVRVVVGRT